MANAGRTVRPGGIMPPPLPRGGEAEAEAGEEAYYYAEAPATAEVLRPKPIGLRVSFSAQALLTVADAFFPVNVCCCNSVIIIFLHK